MVIVWVVVVECFVGVSLYGMTDANCVGMDDVVITVEGEII